MSAYKLQVSIFDLLSADPILSAMISGIYDNPQQIENPIFPFVTIGDDTIEAWDTDTETGFSCEANIHVWSRANHRIETKKIQDAIYSALHRNTFLIDGFTFVGCDLKNQIAQRDQDGLTIHGVQTFKIIFEEI